MSKIYIVTIAYNNEFPIGKIVLNIGECITDKILSESVLAPSYIKKDDGSVEITDFSLINGKHYLPPTKPQSGSKGDTK